MSAGINPVGTVDALQLLIQIEFIWIFDFIICTMYKGETILILQEFLFLVCIYWLTHIVSSCYLNTMYSNKFSLFISFFS